MQWVGRPVSAVLAGRRLSSDPPGVLFGRPVARRGAAVPLLQRPLTRCGLTPSSALGIWVNNDQNWSIGIETGVAPRRAARSSGSWLPLCVGAALP